MNRAFKRNIIIWFCLPVTLTVLSSCQRKSDEANLTAERLRNSAYRVVPTHPDRDDASAIELSREWNGNLCQSRLTNRSGQTVRVKEVVLFTGRHGLPPESGIYGEGFTMLSQTGGTLESPVDIGTFTDRDHYRIPEPDDATTLYNLALVSPPGADRSLLAFTSCRRFQGMIRLRESEFEVVLDTENLAIGPGESWKLEEFLSESGPDRGKLFSALADRIELHHPRLPFDRAPTGWCSWYQFGPKVTFSQVLTNLDVLKRKTSGFEYFQIDDGYQAMMGDWLRARSDFGGDLGRMCRLITQRGFKPGMWLAPFVAEEGSEVFRDHPDWFVQDGAGAPLRSDRVTFGGWRKGPWYVLDGTNPEVRQHLERVFKTMREEWGVRYFKLDALFWGAIHGGHFHDAKATRVEAYRRGMEAILRGAGDAFILAANHPLWPSLGLIHGSRDSMDTAQKWDRIRSTSRESFFRAWQHGRLWFNDPDVVRMTPGDLSEDELGFHWSSIYASGGLLFVGDDLTELSPSQLGALRKMAPPTGVAARFRDESFEIGVAKLPDRRIYFLFNWSDENQDRIIELPAACQMEDFWSGEDLGRHEGSFSIKGMPPHSARTIVCRP